MILPVATALMCALSPSVRPMPYLELLTSLSEQFNEEPIAVAKIDNNNAISLIVNKKTGTWTAVTVRLDTADGILYACPLTSGTDWEPMPQEAEHRT